MQIIFAPPILLLLPGFLFATNALSISVWPLPSNYSYGNIVLWIAEDVQFAYETFNNIVRLLTSVTLKILNPDEFLLSRQIVPCTVIRLRMRISPSLP